MARKKKVLITGGAGFLGSFLAEVLAQKHSVTVIDDLSTGSKENLNNLACQFYRKRVWGPSAIQLLKRGGFDYVFHLAANAYIKTSVEKPFEDFDNNLIQPLRLLEAVRLMKQRPKIILASSAAVHGSACRFPMQEGDLLWPVSPYGAGKLALEQYASVYHRNYGVPVLCVRHYPMFGPRQKKQVVYDLMCKIAQPGKVLEVLGTGREVRDFLYVKDAAKGLALLAQHASFDGTAVNLCSGKGVSTRKIAETLLEVMRIKKKLKFTGQLRKGDVDKMVGSISRLVAFDFAPEYDLVTGLEETVNWFQSDRKRQ